MMNILENTREIQEPKPSEFHNKKSRYLTIKFNVDELDFIGKIKESIRRIYGQDLPLNSIARAMLIKGTKNIDYDQCLQEPMSLFELEEAL